MIYELNYVLFVLNSDSDEIRKYLKLSKTDVFVIHLMISKLQNRGLKCITTLSCNGSTDRVLADH